MHPAAPSSSSFSMIRGGHQTQQLQRVHAWWNQSTVRTGRLSCSRPNLQSTPASPLDIEDGRDPLHIRSFLVASPGYAPYPHFLSAFISLILQDICSWELITRRSRCVSWPMSREIPPCWLSSAREAMYIDTWRLKYSTNLHLLPLQLDMARMQCRLLREIALKPSVWVLFIPIHSPSSLSMSRGNLWYGSCLVCSQIEHRAPCS